MKRLVMQSKARAVVRRARQDRDSILSLLHSGPINSRARDRVGCWAWPSAGWRSTRRKRR